MRKTIHWDFLLLKLPVVFIGPVVFNSLFNTNLSYWAMVWFFTVLVLVSCTELTTTIER